MEEVQVMLFLILLNFLICLTNCCYPGIDSIGKVSPLGDIVAKVGSTIVINCTLKDDYEGPATANNIRWRRNSTKVPRDFITVLDNHTAQLELVNSTMEDSGYYSCYIDLGAEQSTVCNNDVRIGYPPPSAINITCLSMNWQNLTCTWSPPYNPVRTRWRFFNLISKFRLECPVYMNDNTSCFYSEQTQPIYRQAASTYYFYLQGENPLGTERIDFQFEHYEAVLPNPPANFFAIEVNSRELQLRWAPPVGMLFFPPKLFYELYFCSELEPNWKIVEVGLNITVYNLKNLIPSTNYSVKILCRSGASERSPWSRPSHIWKITPADVPGASPKVSSAGFQQRKTLQKRDIYIHWEAIPKILENGKNVSYEIEMIEEGVIRNFAIQEISRTSAWIAGLALEKKYVFRLRTKNEMGVSLNISQLVVEKASQIPPTPDILNVIKFDDGTYEISWMLDKSVNVSEIDHFTLFWCKVGIHHHDYPCYNSDIIWKTINNDAKSVNLSLSTNTNYQFAFALNIRQISSGMMWATCIIPYNGVVNKMKHVTVVQNYERRLEIRWRLDCIDKIGIMEGFNIHYCIFDAFKKVCKDNESVKEYEPDPYAEGFVLSNLRPFTTYKISVSIVTKAGESEESDPVYNTTREGAPEDSPKLSFSLKTNSSIAVAVENPYIANGIIRDIRFYVNSKRWENVISKGPREFVLTDLNSYTNYSVQVTVCTLGELCSPLSPALIVMTDIGIPSPPSISEVRLFNSTHMRIEWEDPTQPNGPLLGWVMTMVWEDVNSNRVDQKEISFPEDKSRIRFVKLPMPCPSSNDLHDRDPEYNLSIRAQTQMLDGLQSKIFVAQPCSLRSNEVFQTWLVTVICVSTFFVLCCILIVLCRCCNRLKKKMKEIQNIKVQLPKGLDSPNVTSLSNYGAYKAQFYNHGETNGNLRVPLSCRPLPTQSDIRSGDGHDPRFSTSSVDELLYVMKGSQQPTQIVSTRLLSEDSSGCSSGHESLSSSITGRTHFSIDSGTDVDPPLSPSYDVIFSALPWKTHPVAKPSKSLPPVHYSQLAKKITAIQNLDYLGMNDNETNVIHYSNSSLSSSDYLEPISPQKVMTVAHVAVALDQQPEKLPPTIPPKPKKNISDSQKEIVPLTDKPGIQNGSRDNEAGYAKIGLSQVGLQNEHKKQLEQGNGEINSQQNVSDSTSHPYLPSGKLVLVPTPLILRTLKLQQLPSEVSALSGYENGIQTKEKCASSIEPLQEIISSSTIVQEPPFPNKLLELKKSPYVTLDDVRNSAVHLVSNQISESDNIDVGENLTMCKANGNVVDPVVKYSKTNTSKSDPCSSILSPKNNEKALPALWKKQDSRNSPISCPDVYSKTYI